jgi:PEP-CTERM motif
MSGNCSRQFVLWETTSHYAVNRGCVTFQRSLIKLCAVAFLLAGTPMVHAAIILSADANYGSPPTVFTIDPEGLGTAERGITATRHLRQTFQTSQTFTVGQIVLSLNSSGTDGGIILNLFEVDDVNATTFTPGNLVKTLTVPTSVDIPDSMTRLGLTLTGADAFVLPQRNTGTQGYGLEISNADDTSTIGVVRHTNSGTDEFIGGRYYTETGGQSGTGNRDFGVALNPVPEPASLLLAAISAVAIAAYRWQVA